MKKVPMLTRYWNTGLVDQEIGLLTDTDKEIIESARLSLTNPPYRGSYVVKVVAHMSDGHDEVFTKESFARKRRRR